MFVRTIQQLGVDRNGNFFTDFLDFAILDKNRRIFEGAGAVKV